MASISMKWEEGTMDENIFMLKYKKSYKFIFFIFFSHILYVSEYRDYARLLNHNAKIWGNLQGLSIYKLFLLLLLLPAPEPLLLLCSSLAILYEMMLRLRCCWCWKSSRHMHICIHEYRDDIMKEGINSCFHKYPSLMRLWPVGYAAISF